MAELLQFERSTAATIDDFTLEERKKCILELLRDVKRKGMDKLIEFLQKSDFFLAPASDNFNLPVPGGLMTHSLHVYYRLIDLMSHNENTRNNSCQAVADTLAIVGLLHEICKVGFYKKIVDRRIIGHHPNGEPIWEECIKYEVDDQMPMGYGEKSLYMIQGFIRLTREEAMAIRWHLGFEDNDFKAGGLSLQKAFESYPLALATYIARIQSICDERNGNS